MLETTPEKPMTLVWNILEEQVQVHLWICISHRYFQFIVPHVQHKNTSICGSITIFDILY